MPEDDPTGPRRGAGLHDSFEAVKHGVARYIGARLALLRIEAGEAAGSAKRKARAGLAGGVLVALAYLLLWAGALGLAEQQWPGSWPWVALIGAGCHLVVGLPLLLMAGRADPKPWFGESLNQLKADEQWMRNLSHRQDPKNPKS